MQNQLAVQMYTIRDFLKTAPDLAQSLARISQMGYPAVQLSAVGAMNGDNPEVSPAQARKMLDDNGLKCIATHRSWDDLANKTEQEIEFHRTLGCDFTAIGGIPGPYKERGAQGYADFVRDAAPVIEKLKAAGIRFGYHNHAFEFERTGFKDGLPQTLFDTFIEAGGPDFLLELDLYWVGHAGINPERIVERSAGRMPVIHIKDKEMVGNEAHMAPIGEGNLDWKNLLPACQKAGVEWIAIEQDTCRRDPFDCLKSSYDFLTQNSFE
ncbi:MAG: sugar phosphate isomerase/epimerase [Armatimonadetes bacterium]|nr:sugar phosphate isomerase/epimerase [Armatimonadota bacterium]